MAIGPVPDGYHSICPYLVVKHADAAIDFYTSVFGATEVARLSDGRGGVAHAELRIGDSILMLADEAPSAHALSPVSLGGSPVRIHLYMDDVDAAMERAVAGGGKVLIPPADQFYGDRSGRLLDPFGHIWIVSTHKEDVSPEEMGRRFRDLTKA